MEAVLPARVAPAIERIFDHWSKLTCKTNQAWMNQLAQDWFGDHPTTKDHVSDTMQAIVDAEAYVRNYGEIVVLDDDAVDLLDHARASMPPVPLSLDALPCGMGIVTRGDGAPLFRVQYEQDPEPVNLAAIAWCLVSGTDDNFNGSLPGMKYKGTFLVDEGKKVTLIVLFYYDISLPPLRIAMGDFTRWDPGAPWRTWRPGDTEAYDDDGTLVLGPVASTMRTFLLALWTLMSERVMVSNTPALPRPVRRRAERLGVPVPTVRFTTLRRTQRDARPCEHGGEVEWSHRWLVRGHWRRLPKDRVTWVRPHVKGPEDKPFVAKRDIGIVRR